MSPTGNVHELRPGVVVVASAQAPVVTPAVAPKPARVQLRLPLDDLEQTERDLVLLKGAIDRSLSQVRRRVRDSASLAAVRQIFSEANGVLNCKRHGR